MSLIGIILKLIEFLGLGDSDSDAKLHNDSVKWEKECSSEGASKLQQGYAKLHDGIAFRLAGPFIYFLVLKQMKDIMSDEDKNNFLD